MCRILRRARWFALSLLAGCWWSAPLTAQPQYAPPTAYAARPTAEQHLQARIETAWMNNPSTATGRLKSVINRGILEVHGDVVNEQGRQIALAIARENCHLPVTDHLRIRPFLVRTPATVPAAPTARTSVTQPAMVSPTARTVPTLPAQAMPVGTMLAQVMPARPDPVVMMQPQRTPMPAPVHPQGYPGTQPVSYPTPAHQTAYRPVQPAQLMQPVQTVPMVPTQRVDLLAPPPATAPQAMAEDLQLLRVPSVAGGPRPAPLPKQPAVPVIARSTQFASTGSYEESAPPGVLLPPPPGYPQQRAMVPVAQAVPVPAAPLSAAPSYLASPSPIAATQPVRGHEAQEMSVPQPAGPTAPVAPVAVDVNSLKRKVQSICGPSAREVNVTMNANQEFVVKILMASAQVEEKLTPRLLGMPELSSGKIRLEIHIPQ